jgi:hypothetical protein
MTTTIITPTSESDTVHVQQRMNPVMIWVSFDKVGFHRYPNAPDEVAYLRDVHRHVFKFKVSISVTHDDREIEFHMFKNWLTSLYEGGDLKVDHKSCEMLAADLLQQITVKYDCTQRRIMIDVSEDGECGATLMSDPQRPVGVSKEWIIQQATAIVAAEASRKEAASKAPAGRLRKSEVKAG